MHIYIINDNLSKTSHRKYLKNKNENIFFLFPTNLQEIHDEIKNIKSCRTDNMSSKILKSCNDAISGPISLFISLSFNNSSAPHMLKIAKVIHIFKKTEKFIPDNFRPTSLLNILNKIMETIMYKRLIIFLEKHDLASDRTTLPQQH